jgi:hypothetical protein
VMEMIQMKGYELPQSFSLPQEILFTVIIFPATTRALV